MILKYTFHGNYAVRLPKDHFNAFQTFHNSPSDPSKHTILLDQASANV